MEVFLWCRRGRGGLGDGEHWGGIGTALGQQCHSCDTSPVLSHRSTGMVFQPQTGGEATKEAELLGGGFGGFLGSL